MSAAAIALILTRIPLAVIAQRLGRIELPWLGALLACKSLLLVAKHRRWRQVLRAMHPGPWRATFRAVAAGYLLNLLVPFKLGELVRTGILRRHNPRASLGDGLATVASERLLDGVALTALSLLALPWIDAPGWLKSGLVVFVVGLSLGLAAALTVPVYRRWIERWSSDRPPGKSSVLTRVVPWLSRVTRVIHRGTTVWRSPRRLTLAAGWSVAIWCCDTLILWMAARALGTSLDYPVAIVVTLLYAFGALIPSGPVQLGTHQALAVVFLTPFGIDEASAVAMSLVLQATNLTVLAAAGAPALGLEASATRRVLEARSRDGGSPNEESQDEEVSAGGSPTA